MGTMTPKENYLDYYMEEWGNGAKIEFILHSMPIEGEHPSDQLELIIIDSNGSKKDWLMNIEDAIVLIRGLSRLTDNALSVNKLISANYKVTIS